MYPMSMKQKVNKKWFILAGIAVVLLGVGGYFLLSHDKNSNKQSPVNKVNYGPPTKEEKAAGDQQKAANEARDEVIKNSTPSGTAQIVLVDANQYFDVVEARAYISNIYEDGGTCTATYTLNNQTVKQSGSAHKDASTTQCEAIDIPRSKFPSGGAWQLVFSYSSATASGSTPAQTVTLK